MTDRVSGSVFLEVDLELVSDSGRERHVSLDDQSGWLVWALAEKVKQVNSQTSSTVLSIRSWGTHCQPTGEKPVTEINLEV